MDADLAVGPPWGHRWAGRIHDHVLDSEVLKDNPLGDPFRRPLYVYTPPAYEAEPETPFPTIYLIQGLTGQVDMWRARKAFRQTVPEAVDALFAEPGQAPALVVFVDCWTSLGGSQYLDSPGHGPLPDVPVRRNRPVGRHALPDAPGGQAPGDHRQVVGRLRGDGGAHAPPGPLRGAGHPRRRRPVRLAYLPEFGPAAAFATLRRVVRAVLGRLPVASGRAEAERPSC